ncbi:DeoR/GlpR family DNA-binding transcription regulator [Jatrophihabitans endophyticus]|uniref:DeoR/GlpR family DNA-binding transcription regulator n=1 Tax=Jatrophihabitans endophyticus TaxID=1206085 RepID=UPI0019D949E5|nr:DeoR/GlpR family DNA-binding transcription regulator [Jatrophihabitans endophyticus]MBE7187713.1 DeoR/GlpR transcriptional regulator [Jatrophihabitans endophyticus]
MLGVERRRLLLQHIRVAGSARVPDLARVVGVSPSTVRRDLEQMDQRGLLTRVRGGASVVEAEAALGREAPAPAARRIGRAAAELVPDGATVLVTGGTSTTAMLDHMAGHRGLTVLTNALDVATALARRPSIPAVVLGGVLRHEDLALRGPLADAALADFHVDVGFCSAAAVDAEVGLSMRGIPAIDSDQRLLAHVPVLVVLAEPNRVGFHEPVRLASVERIDTVVTTHAAAGAAVRALRDRGVRVIQC